LCRELLFKTVIPGGFFSNKVPDHPPNIPPNCDQPVELRIEVIYTNDQQKLGNGCSKRKATDTIEPMNQGS